MTFYKRYIKKITELKNIGDIRPLFHLQNLPDWNYFLLTSIQKDCSISPTRFETILIYQYNVSLRELLDILSPLILKIGKKTIVFKNGSWAFINQELSEITFRLNNHIYLDHFKTKHLQKVLEFFESEKN